MRMNREFIFSVVAVMIPSEQQNVNDIVFRKENKNEK